MRVKWKAYLFLSRFKNLFQAFVMFVRRMFYFLLTVSPAVQWRCFALNGKTMWKILGYSNYFCNCSLPYS